MYQIQLISLYAYIAQVTIKVYFDLLVLKLFITKSVQTWLYWLPANQYSTRAAVETHEQRRIPGWSINGFAIIVGWDIYGEFGASGNRLRSPCFGSEGIGGFGAVGTELVVPTAGRRESTALLSIRGCAADVGRGRVWRGVHVLDLKRPFQGCGWRRRKSSVR